MKYELRSSKQYDKWFAKLKDSSIKIKVLARLDRVENGNFGDFKQIGSNLLELRFFFWQRLANLLHHPRGQGILSAGRWRQIHAVQRH